MTLTHANELARLRERRDEIMIAVALRLCGLHQRPVDELNIPEWSREIIRKTIRDFRIAHPGGLPEPPQHIPIVMRYQRMAGKRFDDEISERFELIHTREP